MEFAPLFPLVYRLLQPTFPHCLWCGNSNSKTIALTFDDGPHPQYTPQVLSVLKRYNITASFFWLGNCVNRFPEIAKTVSEQGHWIGLHGYEHDSFPLLSPIQLKQSLEKTQIAIYNACNLSPEKVRDVRPPNGFFTPQTLHLFQQWNYRPVMWSVVPEDWVHPGVNVVVNRVIKQVKNGSLIVLHDGYFGGKDVAETINILIPRLLQEGYEFVTVDSL
ncbi:polysaccharide deacetylase family protein [Dolichospermum circinale]|jgi:peptidoglycan/xylan/chitin deacetylase (PgdA/CDA1 family)|uniref:polysaccharide deacetylase family protein n=1 Tax=Dolichospermum circinale TaxID=109265 RepID=UPI0007FCA887|nr:polysaccharide deacetylase family protein [Dolichospermum circinale]MDB9451122.1 polysaccharide deacetylase family protein [Dolichospermum circinale CS-547]OBQ41302.1 MAG: chitooligosaccharide deacetylase NodB-like protein [Anabaena sp. MDT14b]